MRSIAPIRRMPSGCLCVGPYRLEAGQAIKVYTLNPESAYSYLGTLLRKTFTATDASAWTPCTVLESPDGVQSLQPWPWMFPYTDCVAVLDVPDPQPYEEDPEQITFPYHL